MSLLPNLDELPEGEAGARFIKIGEITYKADRNGIHPIRDWLPAEPPPVIPDRPELSPAAAARLKAELDAGREALARHAKNNPTPRPRPVDAENPTMKVILAPTATPPEPEEKEKEVFTEPVRKQTEQLGVQERFDEQKAGKGPKAKGRKVGV